MRKRLGRIFIFLSVVLPIVLFAGGLALADTIRLKDGSVLKGKVVSYSQRKFTIVVYIGGSSTQYNIPVDEVESVEFDSSGTAGEAAAGARGASASNNGVDSGASRLEPVTPNPPPTQSPTQSVDPAPTERAAREAITPPGPPPAADPPPAEAEPGAGAVIAEKTVSVAAAADWTSTEIRVQRGQRIAIVASGEVDLGNNQRTGPTGMSMADNRKLILNRPTGGLIAVVGDDNDDFVYIGGIGEFTATHSGILFLSVNEGNLKDNNGSFVARVKVTVAGSR